MKKHSLTAAQRKARQDGLLEKLKQGVEAVRNGEDWKAFLNMGSKFYNYSFGNMMLILWQKPDAARVAGFNAWKKLGRTVKKGEKALQILAPRLRKTKDEETGEEGMALAGFLGVPVFDVSQTEGAELPTVAHRLRGEGPEGLYSSLLAFAMSQGYSVVRQDEGSEKGGYILPSKEIVLNSRFEPLHNVKTLVHELGHGILGHPWERSLPREVREFQAESVAWIVCRELGVETDCYSFGYIAVWTQPGQLAGLISQHGPAIQKAAQTILAGLGQTVG
jgi:antirestriction protein ArdC